MTALKHFHCFVLENLKVYWVFTLFKQNADSLKKGCLRHVKILKIKMIPKHIQKTHFL